MTIIVISGTEYAGPAFNTENIKVAAIKHQRDLIGNSLKESKENVETLLNGGCVMLDVTQDDKYSTNEKIDAMRAAGYIVNMVLDDIIPVVDLLKQAVTSLISDNKYDIAKDLLKVLVKLS